MISAYKSPITAKIKHSMNPQPLPVDTNNEQGDKVFKQETEWNGSLNTENWSQFCITGKIK